MFKKYNKNVKIFCHVIAFPTMISNKQTGLYSTYPRKTKFPERIIKRLAPLLKDCNIFFPISFTKVKVFLTCLIVAVQLNRLPIEQLQSEIFTKLIGSLDQTHLYKSILAQGNMYVIFYHHEKLLLENSNHVSKEQFIKTTS